MNANGTRQSFTDRFWLDTGFDGEMKHNAQFGTLLIGQGLYGADMVIGTAGQPARAKLFSAEITEISAYTSYRFPSPLPVGLVCFGGARTAPLLGLRIMNKWFATFDGPAQLLKIVG